MKCQRKSSVEGRPELFCLLSPPVAFVPKATGSKIVSSRMCTSEFGFGITWESARPKCQMPRRVDYLGISNRQQRRSARKWHPNRERSCSATRPKFFKESIDLLISPRSVYLTCCSTLQLFFDFNFELGTMALPLFLVEKAAVRTTAIC